MKFELSKWGKLYSFTRDGNVYSHKKRKYIKSSSGKSGYNIVTLSDNNYKKKYLIHRVIASIFIPNPENKPCVNHKNGIKTDNRVENLEWVTYSENEIHSHFVLGKKIKHSNETKNKIGKANAGKKRSIELRNLWSRNRKGKPAKNKKPVILNGVKLYGSITEAAKENNISISAIMQNLTGKTKKTIVGVWTYEN